MTEIFFKKMFHKILYFNKTWAIAEHDVLSSLLEENKFMMNVIHKIF